MNKRSVLLLIALIIGVIYLCMQIGNITSHANNITTADPQTAEQAGEAIGTAIGITLLLPHVILIALAVIFNAVGWLGNARWAALTAAILYTVGGVLGFVNFLFVLIPMVLCFVAYKRLGKNLEAVINSGIQFARANGDVVVNGVQVCLGKDRSNDLSLDGDSKAVQPEKKGQPADTPSSDSDAPKQGVLTIVSKSINAKGYMTDDGFIVLKGSQMRKETRKSCRDLILKRREELIASGKVVDYVFAEDVTFSSSSAAAGVILGGDSNGLVCWQNESGVLLKQLQ